MTKLTQFCGKEKKMQESVTIYISSHRVDIRNEWCALNKKGCRKYFFFIDLSFFVI